MNPKATVHPNVTLGRNVRLGDHVVIGEPPRGAEPGQLTTVIGDDAVIRSHTVIYAGNRIGRGFQTGHQVTIRESNTIGDDVSVGTGSVLEHHVDVQDGVRIHSQAFVPEMTVLRRGCWIGPRVCITNARYPLSPNVKNELVGADVGEGAKVGANATLLPGVKIGRNALVGAGSVVTKDVAEGAVVAGNPARAINSVSKLPYGT
ncbi:MAG TPA: acyltransferase [Candidatus Polarisedimenticolaceae bacterium]|nr:acyltransferase [Candidatus Polarisedimenticolaceae bacterium]